MDWMHLIDLTSFSDNKINTCIDLKKNKGPFYVARHSTKCFFENKKRKKDMKYVFQCYIFKQVYYKVNKYFYKTTEQTFPVYLN